MFNKTVNLTVYILQTTIFILFYIVVSSALKNVQNNLLKLVTFSTENVSVIYTKLYVELYNYFIQYFYS